MYAAVNTHIISLISDNLLLLEKKLGFKNKIKWSSTLFVISFHAFSFYWCWNYAFPTKWQTIFFAYAIFIVGGQGITCGLHRFFTHRSFKATPLLKCYLIFAVTVAGQNTICQWVRDHRLHHKHSDTDADPHNAKRGVFFSHIGWLMMKKNDKVLHYGKQIDMSDLENDKYVQFQEKYFTILKLMNCFIIPTMLDIWLCDNNWQCAVAWQCMIRYLVVLHTELTVNSLAHAYGYKPYNKNIVATQNRLVSFWTFGEGWHNYHHVFPFDYKGAELHDVLNHSTFFIRIWAKLGLAYDLKEATPTMIEAVKNRVGDSSEERDKISQEY